MSFKRVPELLSGVLIAAAFAISSNAALAQNRQFSFAYDQPKSSGYGVGAEMFNKKLTELSKGTLSINQYPSAQLGTEADDAEGSNRRHRLCPAVDRQRIDCPT